MVKSVDQWPVSLIKHTDHLFSVVKKGSFNGILGSKYGKKGVLLPQALSY